MLAFDLAGLHNVVSKRHEACLIPRRCANISQPPKEQPLGSADFGKRASQGREVVTPLWPIMGLPYIKIITAIHAAIMNCFRRTAKPIPV